MAKLRRSDTRKKARRDYRKTRRAAKRVGGLFNFLRKKNTSAHKLHSNGYNPYSNIKEGELSGLVDISNDKQSKEYQLILAVEGRKQGTARYLLKDGVNPNVCIISKMKNVYTFEEKPKIETPLIIAMNNDDMEMIKLLLEKGADPTLPKKPGYSPIDIVNHAIEHETKKFGLPYDMKGLLMAAKNKKR
jgi:hypothetical protein